MRKLQTMEKVTRSKTYSDRGFHVFFKVILRLCVQTIMSSDGDGFELAQSQEWLTPGQMAPVMALGSCFMASAFVQNHVGASY